MANLWQSANRQNPFSNRHIGPSSSQRNEMLTELGYKSIEELVDTAVPKQIQDKSAMDLPERVGEAEALVELKTIMGRNKVLRSLIGMGYYDTVTPPVISRNILENPAWYTQYTPYQAEIAQGRLEALLNFQTMICEITELDLANASLLDEGTAAAEAMNLAYNQAKKTQSNKFFVSQNCHPQTIGVVKTRAKALGIDVVLSDEMQFDFDEKPFGILLQYPASNGAVHDYSALISSAKSAGAIVTLATDLLALTILKSPKDMGADIAVGNSQRFGVPLGYGGPHAGFLATSTQYMRKIPGRIVGVSRDSKGRQAYRLTLQTREQHIRRDKATSNICTAQVLLAIMASMYAVYHGPKGLKMIAERTHACASLFAFAMKSLGIKLDAEIFFDTVTVSLESSQADQVMAKALEAGFNLRRVAQDKISVAFDEKSTSREVELVAKFFGNLKASLQELSQDQVPVLTDDWCRKTPCLKHEIFSRYHSETEMMRYIRKLESRDLSLTRSMIPLGSCTMKLNAAAELMPITWPEVNGLHPFAPLSQTSGYQTLFHQLESWLSEITGFDAISLQPNSGAQGEFAGLMVIAKYLDSLGQGHRNICLIPSSAHGTNPASASLAGMKVVVVKCDEEGNIDLDDLNSKAEKHSNNLAALMVTYPSTHGVFEDGIIEICEIIHNHGGQIYMDGANLNAQLGLCKPGLIGPDVCHMNLHKTFCIPHGGGGPGVGPIGVKSHLSPFLPDHPVVDMGISQGVGPISSAPWGSPSILPISWMYIRMMGEDGLREATKNAILNANYIAHKLQSAFPVVYRGKAGLVAHECIIDLKQIKKTAHVTEEDVAKRLIDYGYHAPTVSWPVPHSMMIEPTESESKSEIDRFCEAMISIRDEIQDIEEGKADKDNNLLKNAPHTPQDVCDQSWSLPYSREQAAYPKPWVKDNKFWPHVSRIDNAYGDRNVICSCPPLESYGESNN